MPKKAGIALIVAGAVLISAALLLLLHNQEESAQAGQEAASLLAEVETLIPAQPPEEEPEEPELPVVELYGYACVGRLEIPALGLALPVLDDWDYDRLKLAPCRQFGSSRTDDLVIAAHNYRSHFGRLATLEAGDGVVFTDMDGVVNTYTVTSTGTVQPEDVQAVQESGHDLVLYTCTLGGETRAAVFCDRVEADSI